MKKWYWKFLVVSLATVEANPVANNENETVFQVESFFDVETTHVNKTNDEDNSDNDTAVVKADVPYIPYNLHNYTGVFGDEESSEGRNGTKKEIIRQDYDFKSW